MELEFKKGIPYCREKQFKIEYKGIVLPHCYLPTVSYLDKSFSK